MPLIDKTTNNSWSPEHTNAMLGHIRSACVETLRKRDEEAGIPADAKVYTDEQTNPEKPGVLRIDRELAGKKSTGRDMRLLTVRKWQEFCSEPRDEAYYMDTLGLAVSVKSRARADAESAMLQDEVPDELVSAVKIPGLDDPAGDDPAGDEDTNPATGEAPKRDPKRRRR